jgi:hypothetical protein
MNALEDLQRHLIDDVLADTVSSHDGEGFNGLEVRRLLRQYPTAEMAFVFPRPVTVPQTKFRVRTATTVDELRGSPHTVFYIELSDVQMVRSDSRLGLILQYGEGPTGTKPKDVVWLWGMWGRFCVLRNDEGSWDAYPLGGMIVSELVGRGAPRGTPPPSSAVAADNPAAGISYRIEASTWRRACR